MKIKLIIIFCLLISFILANIHFGQHKKSSILINDAFPRTISIWQSRDIPVNKAVYTLLSKTDLLSREYTNTKNGQKYATSIVLTNERDQIHDPEVCCRGQGIVMNKEYKMILNKDFNINYVDGKTPEKRYHIVYWYTNLDKTYNERVIFMKDIAKELFFDKLSNKFALVIVMADQENVQKKDIFEFSSVLNQTLRSLKEK